MFNFRREIVIFVIPRALSKKGNAGLSIWKRKVVTGMDWH